MNSDLGRQAKTPQAFIFISARSRHTAPAVAGLKAGEIRRQADRLRPGRDRFARQALAHLEVVGDLGGRAVLDASGLEKRTHAQSIDEKIGEK